MRFKANGVLLLSVVVLLAAAPEASLPPLSTRLKPEVYRQVVEDRRVKAHAELQELPGVTRFQRYGFYAAMQVRASLAQTRAVLTDYPLYARMISYVDKARVVPGSSTLLEVEGGIWKFRLSSTVKIQERGERWLHYEIVGGHFKGLSGDFFLEPNGEKGTLVYFDGQVQGSQWPPRLIIERGAEIIFEFTGNRMRSYIESLKSASPGARAGATNEQQIPQPRGRL